MSGKTDESKDTSFQINKIRTIMKSTPDTDVTQMQTAAVHLVSKAAELFIHHVARESFKNSTNTSLQYKDVAKYVQSDASMEYLQPLIPNKITYKEYKKIIMETGDKIDGDDDDSSSESDDSSSSASEKSANDDKKNDNDEEDDDDDGSESVQVISDSAESEKSSKK